MTTPTNEPHAVDVPEAVLRAIDNACEAGVLLTAPDITAAEGTDWERVYAAFSAHRELLAAIATAIREAKEQGAADTARLAELVAAADDILPDDWDTRRCPKLTRLWLAIGEMQNAARAAEPEGA